MPNRKHEGPGLLLKLPPELRNRIYELVLPRSTVVRIAARDWQPPILRTCKTIRREALPGYHANNDFRVGILRSPRFERTLNKLLAMWKEGGGYLRQVYMTVELWEKARAFHKAQGFEIADRFWPNYLRVVGGVDLCVFELSRLALEHSEDT